ncbi:hypothetical protein UPYG_G00091380 [Umbra pygmaea]|uniref:Chemokine interleukin-8-like domain-containing protein n=1 Tax=Umbra pygmaea TaxID=75934 RepID=A0ABD0XFU8_UMBPY
MKNLTALLLLGLFCCFHMMHAVPLALPSGEICCMDLVKVKIPFRQLVSARRTSNNCPTKAIIFKTKKGNQFCVDRSEPWVPNLMTKLENRSATAKTTMMSSKQEALKFKALNF